MRRAGLTSVHILAGLGRDCPHTLGLPVSAVEVLYEQGTRQDATSQLSNSIPGASPLHKPVARHMTTLTRTGMPGPRKEVAESLSTYDGGHWVRMINLTENLNQLDELLYKRRKEIRPIHVAVVSAKLEKLLRENKDSPYYIGYHKIATEMCKYADVFAERMTIGQIASTLKGLSTVQFQMPVDILARFAVVLVANGCQRMQYATDTEYRDVFYGFAKQNFRNRVLWERMTDFLAPKLKTMSADAIASMLVSVARAERARDPFVTEAVQHLCARASELRPDHIPDLLNACSAFKEHEHALLHAFQAQAISNIESLTPHALAGLLPALTHHKLLQPQLLPIAASHTRSLSQSLSLAHLRKLLKAFTWSRHSDPELYSSLATRAISFVSKDATTEQLVDLAELFVPVARGIRTQSAIRGTSSSSSGSNLSVSSAGPSASTQPDAANSRGEASDSNSSAASHYAVSSSSNQNDFKQQKQLSSVPGSVDTSAVQDLYSRIQATVSSKPTINEAQVRALHAAYKKAGQPQAAYFQHLAKREGIDLHLPFTPAKGDMLRQQAPTKGGTGVGQPQSNVLGGQAVRPPHMGQDQGQQKAQKAAATA